MSLGTGRLLYFSECQRHIGAYLAFSFEIISLDSRSGCCLLCLSWCIFNLCESNLFSLFSCLKNTTSWDYAGLLRLHPTWCFIVQLLRYHKAISIGLVTANHPFYEGLEESENFFLSRLDFS